MLPAGFKLDEMHAVIQIAMDGDDNHLHHFMVGNHPFAAFIFFSDPEMVVNEDCLDEAVARLDAILVQPKDKIRYEYEYDFGDRWICSLVLKKIQVVPAAETTMPCCVTGKRACPPQDSRGLGGWEQMRSVLATPNHLEYGHYSAISDPDHDPQAFDAAAIYQALANRVAPEPERSHLSKPLQQVRRLLMRS